MKRLIVITFIITVFVGCKSIASTAEQKKAWDFERYVLDAQQNTNKQKYKSAIKSLFDVSVKYPNENKVTVNYLIGYNFYLLKNYVQAKKHLELVSSLNEVESVQGNLIENEKFVVLSRILLEKIDNQLKSFDPYHIKEDIEANKKVKPKT